MPPEPSRKITAGRYSNRLLLTTGLAAALASVLGIAWWRAHLPSEQPLYPPVIQPDLLKVSETPANESINCVACHANEVAEWKDSHHAIANRLINPQIDPAAFTHGGTFSTNAAKTTLRNEDGIATVAVVAANGTHSVYRPEAAIGVTPLVQYLLPFPGGRLQTLNLAFDPAKRGMVRHAGAGHPRCRRTGRTGKTAA